jgi:ABC-type phosphate transport system substrate-binding protein
MRKHVFAAAAISVYLLALSGTAQALPISSASRSLIAVAPGNLASTSWPTATRQLLDVKNPGPQSDEAKKPIPLPQNIWGLTWGAKRLPPGLKIDPKTGIVSGTPTVPAGVNTAVRLTLPTGCTTPVTVTGFPAPNGTTTNLQQVNSGTTAVPVVRLAGVWPPPSQDPQTFALTITCANGTTGTEDVVDESAPAPTDVAGVGSDTIQSVMDQLSADYNAKPPAGSTGNLYSFDALNPITGAMGDTIVTKQTPTDATTCSQPRPDGSSAGINALVNTQTISGSPCIDFARSSRLPVRFTPLTAINLAGDAVTYATQPGTHAPAHLTATNLFEIFNCTITKWNQIPGNSGGSSDTIDAFIPQANSNTRTFFLTAIGGANFSPGPCVSTSATQAGVAGDNANTLQEDQGVAPSLNGAAGTGAIKADVIFPFLISRWLAERFRSASCGGVSGCYPAAACHPAKAQNLFGCDAHGTMTLNPISEANGAVSNPTTPFPPTKNSVINPGFDPFFTRLLFEVVNQPAANGTIPAYLVPYFGPTGFTCTNSAAKTDLRNYGFLVLPAGTAAGDCGFSR